MRQFLLFALFFLFNIAPVPLYAGKPGTSASNGKKALVELGRDINYILKNTRLKRSRIGIEVYSLWKQEDLFTINKHKLLTPASNMKVITSAAALHYLKPGYVFKTEMSTDGDVRDGHVYGNLYIKGYGDPSLTREEIWKMVQVLKGKGIRFIHGDVVGDDSYFDDKVLQNSWGGKKRSMKYVGEISSLSANFNTIIVHYEPGYKIGQKAHVWLEPETSFVKLKNKSLTRSRRKRFTLNVSGINKGYITAVGSVPSNYPHKTSLRRVKNVSMFATTLFYDFLSRVGFEILGKPRLGIASCENKMLHTHVSKDISEIISGMNKHSNNFTAEQILKTMGANIKGVPGTFENGISVLHDFVEVIGGNTGELQTSDGSGLSKMDLLSPNIIVRTLEYMHDSPICAPEFISSLPIAGVDGTLKTRLMYDLTKRKVRAKTGTISSVSSLSGFLYTRDAEPLAFSMIMNGFRVSGESVHLIQDKICYILSNFSRFDGSADDTRNSEK